MKFVRFALIPLLALSFLGMAKKSVIAVRFHIEANARDGEPFMIPAVFHNPERKGFVEKIPAVSEREIEAVYPVPAADGSFGCVFKLDRHGSIGLQTFSTEKRGFKLVAFVSTKLGTKQVADLLIDKPISDGIIFIPNGLTPMVVTELQKQFDTIGEPKKKR